jgi:hypothetical protein
MCQCPDSFIMSNIMIEVFVVILSSATKEPGIVLYSRPLTLPSCIFHSISPGLNFIFSKYLKSGARNSAIWIPPRFADLLCNAMLQQSIRMSAENELHFIKPTVTCFGFWQPKLSGCCTRIMRRCNVQTMQLEMFLRLRSETGHCRNSYIA